MKGTLFRLISSWICSQCALCVALILWPLRCLRTAVSLQIYDALLRCRLYKQADRTGGRYANI